MITVRLKGGLGNQMFQYAAGRALALQLQTNLTLDLSWFQQNSNNTDTLRYYELNFFALEKFTDLSTKNLLHSLSSNYNHIARVLKRYTPFLMDHYLLESSYNYKNIYNFDFIGKNLYLDGYWQSYLYFHDFAATIRNDFIFTAPINILNQQTLDLIRNSNAVSIHIRRGDYANNQKTHDYHGLAPLHYYYEAIQLILEHVVDPVFVFSDDMSWAYENLKINATVHYIKHNNSAHSSEDMRLMSSCKHHIIANSTYSWWAAWLNAEKNKIVIAPSKWFNDNTIDISSLIPSSWIQI